MGDAQHGRSSAATGPPSARPCTKPPANATARATEPRLDADERGRPPAAHPRSSTSIFATKPAADSGVDLFRRYDLLFEVVSEYGDLEIRPAGHRERHAHTLDHPAHGPLPHRRPPASTSAPRPARIRTPAPEFGQHTEEVLLEAGLSWEEIGALREQGAIGARVVDRAKAG